MHEDGVGTECRCFEEAWADGRRARPASFFQNLGEPAASCRPWGMHVSVRCRAYAFLFLKSDLGFSWI